MYAEFQTLPSFVLAVRDDETQKIINHGGEHPVWSNRDFPPPEIGTVIRIRINGIGPATVTGYFVEDGWLGVLAKPHNPPEWYIKQNGAAKPGHCFGTEIALIPG